MGTPRGVPRGWDPFFDPFLDRFYGFGRNPAKRSMRENPFFSVLSGGGRKSAVFLHDFGVAEGPKYPNSRGRGHVE